MDAAAGWGVKDGYCFARVHLDGGNESIVGLPLENKPKFHLRQCARMRLEC